MRKSLIFICVFIVACMSFTHEVSAVKATLKSTKKFHQGDAYWCELGDGNWKDYNDWYKYLTYQGKDYEAFCVDPGLSAHGTDVYNCMPSDDPGLIEIMNQIPENPSDWEYSKFQLAFRLYAIYFGIGNATNLTTEKAAIVRYAQLADGIGKLPTTTWELPNVKEKYFKGQVMEEAFSIAQSARKTRNGSLISGNGSLSFEKTAEAEKLITYTITTAKPISKIEFECLEGCTIVGAKDAGMTGGTTGTLQVRATSCNKFKIAAYYIPEGVQICSNANASIAGNRQVLITKFTAEGEEAAELDKSTPTQEYIDQAECESKCECTKNEPDLDKAVHNCCQEEPSESHVNEPDLDSMFCLFTGTSGGTTINVDRFCPAKFSTKYQDKDVNDYCTLYCSERVYTLTAGVQSGKAGMYFELSKVDTPKGRTSMPYVNGAKRCRMEVQYAQWHQAYMSVINSEIENYNKAEEQYAIYETWNEAIENKKSEEWTLTIDRTEERQTVDCEAEWIKDDCTVTESNDCKDSDSTSVTSETLNPPGKMSRKITVYKYTPVNTNWKYNTIKLDETGEKMNTVHSKITFKYYQTLTPSESYVYWGAGEDDDPTKFPAVQELDKALKEWEATDNSKTEVVDSYKTSDSTTADCKSGLTKVTSSNYSMKDPITNPYKLRKNAETKANGYRSSLVAAATSAKTLETQIDTCEKWFTKYDGAKVSNHYEFNASLPAVTYSQVYLKDYTELNNQTISIGHSGGCELSGPYLEDVDGKGDVLTTGEYDTVEFNKGGNTEVTIDIDAELARGLKYEKDTNAWENYQHEQFDVDKKFVYDAMYKAECFWKEDGNTQYTLVPTGEVGYTEFNNTENTDQYKIYLTTLEGKFEIEYFLSGLGTKGKFDKYWQEPGTCSGSSTAEHTCYLKVQHEIIYVGECDDSKIIPSGGTTPCEPVKNVDPVFNFKVVDPENIFPSGTTSSSGNYAKNWTSTSAGTTVMNDMANTARQDLTYAPSHISYQFKLDVSDMNKIKDYNTKQESDGGYDDFSLLCTCPETPETCHTKGDGTNTCYRPKSCNYCLSSFIQNAYDGTNTFSDSPIGSNDLSTARNNGNVHWTSQ